MKNVHAMCTDGKLLLCNPPQTIAPHPDGSAKGLKPAMQFLTTPWHDKDGDSFLSHTLETAFGGSKRDSSLAIPVMQIMSFLLSFLSIIRFRLPTIPRTPCLRCNFMGVLLTLFLSIQRSTAASLSFFPPVPRGASLATLESLTALPNPSTFPDDERERSLDPHASDPNREGLPIGLSGASSFQSWVNASVGGIPCEELREVAGWEPDGAGSVGMVCEGIGEGESGKVVGVGVMYRVAGGGVAKTSMSEAVKFDDLSSPIVDAIISTIGDEEGGGPSLSSGEKFGQSMCWVGGDSQGAVLVGAQSDSTGFSSAGAVYLMRVGKDGKASDVTKTASDVNGGPTLGAQHYFGASVAWLGDLDGDGEAWEVVVGAQESASMTGSVYVMRVGIGETSTVMARITDNSNGGPSLDSNDRFGTSVSCIGDVDGDGIASDIAVGAYYDDTGGTNRGAVYVIRLLQDGSGEAFATIAHGDGSSGPTLVDIDGFGFSLSLLCGSDGRSCGSGTTLAVGAIYDDTGSSNAGALHVVQVGTDASVSVRGKIASGLNGGPSLVSGGLFGSAIAVLGDLDADAGETMEVLVGSFFDATGGTERGAAYVLSLDMSSWQVVWWRKISSSEGGAPALENNDNFGVSAALLGDVTGAGRHHSVAIGAINRESTGGGKPGALFILSLADLTSSSSSSSILAAHPESLSSLHSAQPTFAIPPSSPEHSLPYLDPHATDPSRRVLPLSVLTSTFNASHTLTILNASIDSRPCTSVQLIPDWPTSANTRRIGVACVGLPEGESGKEVDGVVWVEEIATGSCYSISSSSLARYDDLWTTPGIQRDLHISRTLGGGPTSMPNSANFGAGMAWIGDVDGDGCTADIAVGAERDQPLTYGGSVYVFSVCGGEDAKLLNKIAHETGGGPTLPSQTYFGQVVSWVGDVDGDGRWSDIAVHAGDIFGGPGSETVYILSLDSTAHATLVHTLTPASGTLTDVTSLDWVFRLIGDIDNDGRMDYITREAVLSLDGGSFRKSYPVSGFSKLQGEFGNDMTAIGDVDGDGDVEIAVGIRNYFTASRSRGAVQVLSLATTGSLSNLHNIIPGVGEMPLVSPEADFGWSLTWAGDVDGDGRASDLLVGAPGESTGGTDAGAVYLIALSSNGAPHFVHKIAGKGTGGGPTLHEYAYFGESVAWCGDSAGQGVSSGFAVGARRESTKGSRVGSVFLYRAPDLPVLTSAVEGAMMPRASVPTSSPVSGQIFPALSPFPGHAFVTLDPHASDPSRRVLPLSILTMTFNASFSLSVLNASFDSRPCASTSIISSWPVSTNTRRIGVACVGVPEGESGKVVGAEVWVEEVGTGTIYSISSSAVARYDDLSTPAVTATKKIASETNGGPSLTNGDLFGGAVAFLGDVTGDGKDTDIAVGASLDDTGDPSSGAVYIMSLALDGSVTTLAKIASSVNGGPDTPYDHFGCAIALLGDLTGDGRATDIAVGAHKDDDKGAIHILSLATDGSATAVSRIASGVNGGPTLGTNDLFGNSIALLGDIDGDGVAFEIAVGAVEDDTGGSNRGIVYVMSLFSDGTATVLSTISSGSPSGLVLEDDGLFGGAIALLGDVTGDGRPSELVVSAKKEDEGGTDRGALYVLTLATDGSATQLSKIASNTNGGPMLSDGDRFGESVARLGDVTGDGRLTDFAVGATGNTANGGTIFILSLDTNGLASVICEIASEVSGGPLLSGGDEFGTSIVRVGDLAENGAAGATIVVGSIRDDTGGTDRGAVYVLSLVDFTDASSSATIFGAAPASSTPSTGPLVPSHFLQDALPHIHPHATSPSRSTLPLSILTSTFNASHSLTILNASIDSRPCASTSLIPDWPQSSNTRRIGVACVGVPEGESGKVVGAEVWVEEVGTGVTYGIRGENVARYDDLRGSDFVKDAVLITSDTNGGPTLTGNGKFGYALASIGDVTGNGRPTDIAVGAVTCNCIFTLSVNTDGTVSLLKQIAFGSSGDWFGVAIELLGDLTEDGRATDIAVGAMRQGSGAVYLLSIASDGSATEISKIASNANGGPTLDTSDEFGSSLASIGDLTGSGRHVLAVGAHRRSVAGGVGVVYLLSLSKNGVATVEGEVSAATVPSGFLSGSQRFGISAVLVGDVNGDGSSFDIAVGDDISDEGGGNSGSVFLLSLSSAASATGIGKINANTVPAQGPPIDANDQFGFAVSAMGDIDGDGVPDIAVGAINVFAVYLVLLKTSGEAKSSIDITTNDHLTASGNFGRAVGLLPDAAGDGWARSLLVGADTDNTAGNTPGAIHIVTLGDATDANSLPSLAVAVPVASSSSNPSLYLSPQPPSLHPQASSSSQRFLPISVLTNVFNATVNAELLGAKVGSSDCLSVAWIDGWPASSNTRRAGVLCEAPDGEAGAYADVSVTWRNLENSETVTVSGESLVQYETLELSPRTPAFSVSNLPQVSYRLYGTGCTCMAMHATASRNVCVVSAPRSHESGETGSIFLIDAEPRSHSFSHVATITEGTTGVPSLGNPVNFGESLLWIGDLDEDGTQEVAVSAPAADGGRVFVFSITSTGSVSTMDTVTFQTDGSSPTTSSQYFGNDLSFWNEFGSDRLKNVLLVADTGAGGVFLTSFDSGTKTFRFEEFVSVSSHAIAVIGDVDGDGVYEEVVVASKSHVYTKKIHSDFSVTNLDSENLGLSAVNQLQNAPVLFWAGDVNGDGLTSDFLLGVSAYDGSGSSNTNYGIVYFYAVHADGTMELQDGTATSSSIANFPGCLASLGDFDGDASGRTLLGGSPRTYQTTGFYSRVTFEDMSTPTTPPQILGAGMPQSGAAAADIADVQFVLRFPQPPLSALPQLDVHATNVNKKFLPIALLTNVYNPVLNAAILNVTIGGVECTSSSWASGWPSPSITYYKRRAAVLCETPEGVWGRVVGIEVSWKDLRTGQVTTVFADRMARYQVKQVFESALVAVSTQNGIPNVGPHKKLGRSAMHIPEDINGDGLLNEMFISIKSDGDILLVSVGESTFTHLSTYDSASDVGTGLAWLGDVDGDGEAREFVAGRPVNQGDLRVMKILSDYSLQNIATIASASNGGPELNEGALFGHSVAFLGDVDKDGRAFDIAVGAPGASEVYVLSIEEDGSAREIGTLPFLYTEQGLCVANVGDLDEDGFDDIIIGALGKLYLVKMAKDPAEATTWSSRTDPVSEQNSGSRKPYNCGILGDVNADGHVEVVAGVEHVQVDIISINKELYRFTTLSTITASTPLVYGGGKFGSAVGSAGDFNGDGMVDSMFIGAYNADYGSVLQVGALGVYTFVDTTDKTTSPLVLGTGFPLANPPSPSTPLSLASPLLATSTFPSLHPHGTDPTRRFLPISILTNVFNATANAELLNATVGDRPCLSTSWLPQWSQASNSRRAGVLCEVPDGESGTSVRIGVTWRDIRDGSITFVESNKPIARYDNLWLEENLVTLLVENSGTFESAGWTSLPTTSNRIVRGHSGLSSGVGGKVYVGKIGSDGKVSANSVEKNGEGSDGLGTAVDFIGDLDGDGYSEVAIGAYKDDAAGTDRGALHILTLEDDDSLSEKYVIDASNTPSLSSRGKFGFSVSWIGDLNQDGDENEVVVGAYFDSSSGAEYSGAFYIMSLQRNGEGVVLHKETRVDSKSLGWGVSWIGDADGDGKRNEIAVSGDKLHFYSLSTSGNPTEIGEGIEYDKARIAWLGDYDVDGIEADLAVGIGSKIDIVTILPDGSALFRASIPSATNPTPAFVGDLNGDGIGNELIIAAKDVVFMNDVVSRVEMRRVVVGASLVDGGTKAADLSSITTAPITSYLRPVPIISLPHIRINNHTANITLLFSIVTDIKNISATFTVKDILIDGKECKEVDWVSGWPQSENPYRASVGCISPPGEGEDGKVAGVRIILESRGSSGVIEMSTARAVVFGDRRRAPSIKSSTRLASGVHGAPTLDLGARFGHDVVFSRGDLTNDNVLSDILVVQGGKEEVGVVSLGREGKIVDDPYFRMGGIGQDVGLASLGANIDADGEPNEVILGRGDMDDDAKGSLTVFGIVDYYIPRWLAIADNSTLSLSTGDRFASAACSFGYEDETFQTVLFAVGAKGTDSGRGAVYLLAIEPPYSTPQTRVKITSGENGGPLLSPGSRFGASLSRSLLFNLSSSGEVDLYIGARGEERVYLFDFANIGEIASGVVVSAMDRDSHPELALSEGDGFGESIAALGDLDCCGNELVAVGAPFAPNGGVVVLVSVTEGGSRVVIRDKIASQRSNFPPLSSGAEFGFSLSAIEADIFGNGFAVGGIVVGAPGEESGKGALYVLELEEMLKSPPQELTLVGVHHWPSLDPVDSVAWRRGGRVDGGLVLTMRSPFSPTSAVNITKVSFGDDIACTSLHRNDSVWEVVDLISVLCTAIDLPRDLRISIQGGHTRRIKVWFQLVAPASTEDGVVGAGFEGSVFGAYAMPLRVIIPTSELVTPEFINATITTPSPPSSSSTQSPFSALMLYSHSEVLIHIDNMLVETLSGSASKKLAVEVVSDGAVVEVLQVSTTPTVMDPSESWVEWVRFSITPCQLSLESVDDKLFNVSITGLYGSVVVQLDILPPSIRGFSPMDPLSQLSPFGGSNVEVFFDGLGMSNISTVMTSQCQGIVSSIGQQLPSFAAAVSEAVSGIALWVYVNGRACESVEWSGPGRVNCTTSPGFGEQVKLHVIADGRLLQTNDTMTLTHQSPPPPTSISPSSNLPVAGGTAILFSSLILDVTTSRTGITLTSIHMGPWELLPSSGAPLVDSTVQAISPAGGGVNHSVHWCFEDDPTEESEIAPLLSPTIFTACTTVSDTSLSFNAPILSGVSPSVDLDPLGGDKLELSGSNFGDPTILSDAGVDVDVLINGASALSIAHQGDGEIVCYTRAMPGQSIANIEVIVGGGVSNTIQASVLRVSLLSVVPRQLMPAAPGKLFYNFDISVFAAEEVTGVVVGGERCANFYVVDDELLRCDGVEAPTQWETDDAWLEINGKNESVSRRIVLRTEPPPSILAIDSSNGAPTSGGTLVIVVGEGFGILASDFDGVVVGGNADVALEAWKDGGDGIVSENTNATFVSRQSGAASFLSSTRVSFVLPPGYGSRVPVRVATAVGLISSPVTFSYNTPTLSTMSPDILTHKYTPTRLLFNGTNLAPPGGVIDSVLVGGLACDSPTPITSTSFFCDLTPSTNVGAWEWESESVEVVVGGVASAPTLGLGNFVPLPFIEEVVPSVVEIASTTRINGAGMGGGGKSTVQGVLVGGKGGSEDEVLLRYRNFSSIASAEDVVFADVSLWRSGTSFDVVMPRGVGNVLVRFATVSNVISNAVSVSYASASLTEMEPSILLPGIDGITVTLRGRNFAPEQRFVGNVTIGGIPCPTVQAFSPTEMICENFATPGSSATQFTAWQSQSVKISVAGVSSTTTIGTYVPPPRITNVIPGEASPGDTVQIIGEGFGSSPDDVAAVEINGFDTNVDACASWEWVSSSELRCTLPESHSSWELAESDGHGERVFPLLSAVVELVTGIRSTGGEKKVIPSGLRIRPNPFFSPTLVVAWRPVGQSGTIYVRWRYMGPEIETMATTQFMHQNDTVPPLEATRFEVEAIQKEGDPNAVSVEVPRESATRLATITTTTSFSFNTENPLDPNALEWHEARLPVFFRGPLLVRVRAANGDGAGPWAYVATKYISALRHKPNNHSPVHKLVFETCLQSEYLSPGHNDHSYCKDCPGGAACYGLHHDNVTALGGYWRVPWASSIGFAKCFIPSACIGVSGDPFDAISPRLLKAPAAEKVFGWNATQNTSAALYSRIISTDFADIPAALPGASLDPSLEDCAEGHRGVLCSACRQGYFPGVGGVCTACGHPGWIAGRLLLLVLAVFTGFGILLVQAWRTRAVKSSKEVIALKVCFTHLQSVAIVGSVGLQWPNGSRQFFEVVDAGSSFTTSGLALECIMGQASQSPFLRTIVIIFMPCFLIAFAAFLWISLGVFSSQVPACARCLANSGAGLEDDEDAEEEDEEAEGAGEDGGGGGDGELLPRRRNQVTGWSWRVFAERMMVSAIVTAFLVHTPLTSAAFKLLTCRPIAPEDDSSSAQLRLAMDMDVLCTDPESLLAMVGIAIPVILVVSLGVPLAAALFLRFLGAKKLQTRKWRSLLGFLYNGYTKRMYAWESVVLLRKVMLAFVTTILSPSGPVMQILTANIVVLIALVVHTRSNPYGSAILNALEAFALVAAALTLTGGMFVVADSEGLAGQAAGIVGIVASFIIITVNILFLIFVAVLLSKRGRQAAREAYVALLARIGIHVVDANGKKVSTTDIIRRASTFSRSVSRTSSPRAASSRGIAAFQVENPMVSSSRASSPAVDVSEGREEECVGPRFPTSRLSEVS